MSTKPLEIKNYLSEKLELLRELLNKGEDTLLVSPTDSGKTRAIITYAKQNPQRRIAILCPIAFCSLLIKLNNLVLQLYIQYIYNLTY